MILALRKRHDYFAEQGCKLSDHGIEEFYAEDYTEGEIKTIFNKIYGGSELTKEEVLKFKLAMLIVLGEMDWEKRMDTTISLRGRHSEQLNVQAIVRA